MNTSPQVDDRAPQHEQEQQHAPVIRPAGERS